MNTQQTNQPGMKFIPQHVSVPMSVMQSTSSVQPRPGIAYVNNNLVCNPAPQVPPQSHPLQYIFCCCVMSRINKKLKYFFIMWEYMPIFIVAEVRVFKNCPFLVLLYASKIICFNTF